MIKKYVCPNHSEVVLFKGNEDTTDHSSKKSAPIHKKDKTHTVAGWGLHTDLPEMAMCDKCDRYYYKTECKTID